MSHLLFVVVLWKADMPPQRSDPEKASKRDDGLGLGRPIAWTETTAAMMMQV